MTTTREAGERRCPVCADALQPATQDGVTIDVCPAHGVWLDHGELEAIQFARFARGHQRRARRLQLARMKGQAEGVVSGWFVALR